MTRTVLEVEVEHVVLQSVRDDEWFESDTVVSLDDWN